MLRWLGKQGAAVHRLHICVHYNHRGKQDWAHFRGGAVALLSQTPNLQELAISGGKQFFALQHDLYVMEHLPKLKSLTIEVTCKDPWSEDTLDPLKHLTGLTSLVICVKGLYRPLSVSSELAALTQLQVLDLQSSRSYMDVSKQAALMQTLSQLTGLTRLALTGMLDNVPLQLANLAQLEVLSVSRFLDEAPSMSIPACLVMCSRLEYINLGSLSHDSINSWWGICHSLQCLPSLHSLSLQDMDLARVPHTAWTLSSALTFLELDHCKLVEVPPAVQQLPDLREFAMTGTPVERFDGGAYLQNLTELAIEMACTKAGPEALEGAKHLQSLTVSSDDVLGQGLWTASNLKTILPEFCSIKLLQMSRSSTSASSPRYPRSLSRSLSRSPSDWRADSDSEYSG